MPVDRELAAETLKRFDEGLYALYRKIQDLDDYVKKDPESYGKLQVYLLSLEALDDLERTGAIEIVNDYEHGAIYVRNRERVV